jgi:hypothetical protein
VIRSPATFLRRLSARGVHDDSSHDLGRDRQKMITVLPFRMSRLEQAKVRFIQNFGRLERATLGLIAEIKARQTVELLVDQRRDFVQCGAIAIFPSS